MYYRKLSLPSSGPKDKQKKKKACSRWQVEFVGVFFGLFFEPGNGSDIFLRSFGCPSTDCTALYL
jgi:hypothetical protein